MGKQDGHRSTLAIHLGALGDYILAVPALSELARLGPVEVWGPSQERLSLALAPRGPVARTRVLPHELFGEEPGPALRSTSDFERVVVFSKKEGPLARALPGALFADTGSEGHVSDVLLDRLGARGWASSDPVRHPALSVSRQDAGILVVQPGAGGRSKRWAPSCFEEVARRSGLETVCLLGPAELDPPERALRFGARVVEAPSMEELIGLLATARAFVGNDAGVTHLAAALSVPTVAVFGPTDPSRWAPRGPGRVEVVRAPGGDLTRLDVAPVLEALNRLTRGGANV